MNEEKVYGHTALCSPVYLIFLEEDMKKGEIYEGIIERVEFPNKGYVKIDGENVIVKNGIPGQKVRFMINKKRSGRAEGRLLEVLEKSPLKQENRCAVIFLHAAAVCTRPCLMRNS